ncbi:reverse transcriptase domain-containing protein [Tanacetum coccineum]
MDDEPMWAAKSVVASTLGFTITIPETVNEFAIKAIFDRLLREIRAFSQHENDSLIDAWLCMKEMLRNCHGHNLSKGNIIKIFYHGLSEITQEVLNAATGGIFLYKTPNQAYQLLEDKVLLKLDWAKNQKTKSSLKKTIAFASKSSSNTDTEKIMARMDTMTIKMDAQYKELQSRAKKPTPDLDEDDMPMSREEEAKFIEQNDYNQDNYRSNTDDKSYDLQKQFNDFMKSQQSTNTFVKDTFMDLKTQLETVAKNNQASIQNLKTKFDRLADKQSGRPSGSLPSNTQPNPKGHNSKSYQPPQSYNEMPKALISDRGTHFCNKIIEKTMKRYGVNHRFSTSYHPQTSGQVENTNKALKRILKKTVKDNLVIWSRKLDDALWAFRTTYKTPTGTTPYKLIYGKNYHLPFEIEHRAYWALKNCNPDLITAGEKNVPVI